MIRRPPRSTPKPSSAASDVYKRQGHIYNEYMKEILSKCPSEWRNNLIDRFHNTNSNTQTQNLIALNEKSLVRMNQTIKKVMQTHHRVHCQYMNVIKDAIELENIGRNKMNINRYHKLALPNHASSHHHLIQLLFTHVYTCLLYTSPSPRDRTRSRMPSSA